MSAKPPTEPAESLMINGIKLYPRIAELIQGEGTQADLFRACVYGDPQRIPDLLNAESRLVNFEGGGPSKNAALGADRSRMLYGRREVMEVLLERGTTVERIFHGETLLHIAAANGHAEVVELLIERGANVNALISRGKRPLKVTLLSKNVFRTTGGEERVVRLLREIVRWLSSCFRMEPTYLPSHRMENQP